MAGGAGGSLGGAFSAGRGSVCIPGLGVKGGRGGLGAGGSPRELRLVLAGRGLLKQQRLGGAAAARSPSLFVLHREHGQR